MKMYINDIILKKSEDALIEWILKLSIEGIKFEDLIIIYG